MCLPLAPPTRVLKWSRRRVGSPVLQELVVGGRGPLFNSPHGLHCDSTEVAGAGVVAGRRSATLAGLGLGPALALARGGPSGLELAAVMALSGTAPAAPGSDDKVNDLRGRCLVDNVKDGAAFQFVGASRGARVPARRRAVMPLGSQLGPSSALRPMVVSLQSASGMSNLFLFPFTIALKLQRLMLLSPVLHFVVLNAMASTDASPTRACPKQGRGTGGS
jgi:hypothetical protein